MEQLGRTEKILIAITIAAALVATLLGARWIGLKRRQEEASRQELIKAIEYRNEREQYIKEYVQEHLQTTQEIDLWFYSYQGYENGWINRYTTEVDGKKYDIKATYVDYIVEIEIEEIQEQ